jgi:hypothetical protein
MPAPLHQNPRSISDRGFFFARLLLFALLALALAACAAQPPAAAWRTLVDDEGTTVELAAPPEPSPWRCYRRDVRN